MLFKTFEYINNIHFKKSYLINKVKSLNMEPIPIYKGNLSET